MTATMRASVVFPVPGGPYRIIEPTRSSAIADRSAEPSPSTCSWPTNCVERPRAEPQSERSRRRPAARGLRRRRGRSRAEVCSRRGDRRSRGLHAARPSRARAASDYERYLRTDELLALQKRPDERVHRDELLFQTVHQASELWLKLAWNEVEVATALLGRGELAPAERLLRRAIECVEYVIAQLDMLEHMSPWEYQEIRQVLGHGSGFDSPGFREIRRVDAAARPGVLRSCFETRASTSSSSTAQGVSTRISTSSPSS